MKLRQQDLMGEAHPSGTQMIYVTCPVCHDGGKHFHVNIHTGGYDCKKCGVAGYLDGFVPSEEQILEMAQDHTQDWKEMPLPEVMGFGVLAASYLRGRGIIPTLASSLGWAVYSSRILVPFYDDKGLCIYWQARSYLDQEPKYKNAGGRHPLYVPDWHTEDNVVVLVEGVFDAIQVFDAGFKAVALCGKSLPIYLRAQFLQATQGSRLVVMLDPDAAAESLRLAEQYDGVVAVCPAGKDPGDMTGPEISKAISDAVRSAEEVSHDM